jgi:S1-C subfamily serine protease
MSRRLFLSAVGSLLYLAGLLAGHTAERKASEAALRLISFRYKDGSEMLEAFSPVSAVLRHSTVKLDLDGSTAAMATVIDTNGLALTKASEIKKGRLTSWVAGGREVDAEILATDEQSDLALVRIHTQGLKPVQWATQDVVVGQWTISPGPEEVPQAVGIVSVPPRTILPKRAYIGVSLDVTASVARIANVTPGLGADKAGLRSNDVVVAVNGSPVRKGEDLIEHLRTFREGQTAKLHIERGDEEFDANVLLMSEQAMFGRRSVGIQSLRNRLMTGEVSERSEDFGLAIQHDTVLEPWLCGGPLVNLDNKAIGINIARAGRVASYALPANLAQQAITRLLAKVRITPASTTPSPP